MSIDTTSTIELPEYQGETCSWYDAPCHASSFAEWLSKFLEWLPQKVFQQMTEGLSAMVNAIPAPEFLADASGYMGGIPSSVMFFAGPLQLGPGLAIIATAYTLRFAVRRLPVVG